MKTLNDFSTADPFGHASAALAGLKVFELSSRGTGRTSRMLAQVRDGDLIVCLTVAEKHRLQGQMSPAQKAVAVIVVHDFDIDQVIRRIGRPAFGRVFVDHEWCRAYFEHHIGLARSALTLMLNRMSSPPESRQPFCDEASERLRDAVRRGYFE